MNKKLKILLILVASVAVMAMAFDAGARGNGKGKGKHGKGMGKGNCGMMNPDMQPGNPDFGPGPGSLGIDLKLHHSDTLRSAMEELGAAHMYDTLNLTAEQQKAIKKHIEEIRELRKQADTIRGKYEQLMLTQIKAIPKGKQPDDVVIKNMQAMQKLRREYREATLPIKERAIDIGKSLAGIITPDQYTALREMPKMFMKALSGDSTSNPWALAFVDRLRLMPQQRYEKMKSRVGDNMPLTADQRAAFFAQVEHIRSLSAADYEASRSELAAAIDPAIVDMIQQHRGGRGMGKGMGKGMGNGMGKGMGPGAGMGQGMMNPDGQPCMGPGPGMGPGRHLHKGHLWRIITSDAFYNLLK